MLLSHSRVCERSAEAFFISRSTSADESQRTSEASAGVAAGAACQLEPPAQVGTNLQ